MPTLLYNSTVTSNPSQATDFLVRLGTGSNAIFTKDALYANVSGGSVVWTSFSTTIQVAGSLYADGDTITIDPNQAGVITNVRVSITNGGLVSSTSASAIDLNASFVHVANAGSIEASRSSAVVLDGQQGSFVNTGSVTARGDGVSIGGYGSIVTNVGTITANGNGISWVGANAAITNNGQITSIERYGVQLTDTSGGDAYLTNTGDIDGRYAGISFYSSSTGLTINLTNSGTIVSHGLYGIITAGSVGLAFSNTGTITGKSSSLDLSSGVDTIFNSGTLNGAVELYGGDDVFDSSAGVLNGAVSGGGGNDTLTGSVLGDRLYGDADDDVISGLGGNDMLRGGAGADALDGGDGVDTADYASASTGIVADLSGALYGVGDAAGDTFISIERLSGSSFNDFLYGDDASDTLVGSDGDDYLDGRGGRDVMIGGRSDDTYVVDFARDTINEKADEGTDLVLSSVSYMLGANVENVTLTGTAAINATGNDLPNLMTGNAAANILDGRGGNDYMQGGAGDDTYYVDAVGDQVKEVAGQGFDQVFSSINYSVGSNSIEKVTLIGSARTASGGKFDDLLVGNELGNTFRGLEGNDTLTGGAASDQFRFDTKLDGATNVDHITDFEHLLDKMLLASGIFTGLAKGTLPASVLAFGSGAGDADDRIVYNQATGTLFYDADGTGVGAQVAFAVLDTHPVLTSADFIVG